MTLFLLIMTAIAAGIDIRTKKIPNWLTGSLLLVGNIYCLMIDKGVFLLTSMTVLLLFLPFPIGGGDKKMLMTMPLYLHESTMIYLGCFGICYLTYGFHVRRYDIHKDTPLGPAILLCLVVTIILRRYVII